ncbi:MAG: SRPBCC domain-containing protein [Actinomycetota bacterium]|nr:SRPBCC domain-containing protein [Actinomycetota bacterium]
MPLDGGPSMLVEFTLRLREDGGTTLHLRESGFERPEHPSGNADGWTDELGELVAYLAGDGAIAVAWSLGLRVPKRAMP